MLYAVLLKNCGIGFHEIERHWTLSQLITIVDKLADIAEEERRMMDGAKHGNGVARSNQPAPKIPIKPYPAADQKGE